MEHATEGRIRFTSAREGGIEQLDSSMKRTHYGHLHGEPSRLQLELNIDKMVTIPGQGELVMEGPIADACAPLEIPDQPLVSIWIEEMNFKMGKPVLLPEERPPS